MRESHLFSQAAARYIVHIASRLLWGEAVATGIYQGDTLRSEGFIHCSTINQVVSVANRYFRGRKDLVLLLIDATLVYSPIKFEGTVNELYPHIYGPLNTSAVLHIFPFLPKDSGDFQLPSKLIERCALLHPQFQPVQH